MVKAINLFVLFILLLANNVATAGSAFSVKLSQDRVELGKPIWLTLRTTQTSPSLNTINFSALQQAFAVVKDRNEIRHTGKGQAWRIRLYARSMQSSSIASLSFAKHKSLPLSIKLTKPVDSKTRQSFDVRYQVSTTTAWLRQQVLVTYQVASNTDRLVLQAQQAELNNMLLIPLDTRTTQQANQFIHQTGWAVFATKAGTRTIQLPALHYVRDGVATHRFYPPALTLTIKPLPEYLPGNIPVGRLSMQDTGTSRLVTKGDLNTLRLTLTGNGIPQAWLPDIRHAFNSPQGLSIYPVGMLSSQSGTGQVQSQHRYRLPFKTTAQGNIGLGLKPLHYFDPNSGKLAQLQPPGIHFVSLSGWLLILLVVVGLGLTIWLWRVITAWFIPHWRCLRSYHAALKTIPGLQTATDFKQLIRQLCEGEGWSSNLSLRQWQKRLPENVANAARDTNQQLEPALYHGNDYEIDKLRTDLVQVCLNRWPILRWVRV